jgi:hypothetical protein
MCFNTSPKEESAKVRTHKRSVDSAAKLRFVRAQAKLLGYGDQIYISKRHNFKYVILRDFDAISPLITSRREIHFGDNYRQDYLDTNDETKRSMWHFLHERECEYDDPLCGLYYERHLLY